MDWTSLSVHHPAAAHEPCSPRIADFSLSKHVAGAGVAPGSPSTESYEESIKILRDIKKHDQTYDKETDFSCNWC